MLWVLFYCHASYEGGSLDLTRWFYPQDITFSTLLSYESYLFTMMQNKGYFETYKRGLLPWVTDWTDDQNEIRFETNIKKLKLVDWIFCHPQGFKLINYGQHVLTAFWLTPVMFLLWDRVRVLSVLVGILLFFNARTFGKKMRLRKLYTQTTYYDIYMKEIKLDEVKGQYD